VVNALQQRNGCVESDGSDVEPSCINILKKLTFAFFCDSLMRHLLVILDFCLDLYAWLYYQVGALYTV
jgi:hypothetical protein